MHRFTNEPLMLGAFCLQVPSYCKTKFEWHIESRSPGPNFIEFNPREIVKGVLAGSYQINYFFEASGAIWDFESRSGYKSEGANACNIC